jgi:hypothetical protein
MFGGGANVAMSKQVGGGVEAGALSEEGAVFFGTADFCGSSAAGFKVMR